LEGVQEGEAGIGYMRVEIDLITRWWEKNAASGRTREGRRKSGVGGRFH